MVERGEKNTHIFLFKTIANGLCVSVDELL